MFDQVTEELAGLPDSALDGRIRELELERRRLDAELAAAIALAEHRRLPAVDGHRSVQAYLRATLNWSDGEASRFRSVARAVDHVDGLGEAWHSGRIGVSQAVRFGRLHGNRRVREQLPEFAPILLEHAEQLPDRDLAVCVARFVALADADGAHDRRDDAVEHRDAHVNDVGGMLDLTAHGGHGTVAAELIAIHRRFTDVEYRADVETRRAEHGAEADQHPLARTDRQRRFDALVAIFRMAAEHRGVGSPTDPLVNIVIDAHTWARLLIDSGLGTDATLAGDVVDPFTGVGCPDELLGLLTDATADLATRRCETADGVVLHPHDVLRAALAGHVRRVVVDTDGVVIDFGRRQRLFAGAAREAAKLLILHCEHPGCDLPADSCDVDHTDEWSDGGATDQANARLRCGSHNTMKSRRRWRSRRATNGRTYTIRPDGTIMLPVGARPPTFPTDEEPDDPIEVAEAIVLARRRAAALTAA